MLAGYGFVADPARVLAERLSIFGAASTSVEVTKLFGKGREALNCGVFHNPLR